MADITKEEIRERLGNIDQIRDIIFGSQIREIDTRFNRLESDLSKLQQDMQNRIDQVKTVLITELRASNESLEKKLKSLALTSQEEGADVRQQIDRLNRKFSANVEALDESIDKQTASLRDDLSQTRDKLQDEVLLLKNQVFEELERRFSLLREVKVSRDDMAELLFELGMRLKGNEFVPQLKEAADSNIDGGILLTDKSYQG
jgi:DNA anti-recombination protein RmuC